MNSKTVSTFFGMALRHGLTGTGLVGITAGAQSGDILSIGAGVAGLFIGFGLSWINKKATGQIQ